MEHSRHGNEEPYSNREIDEKMNDTLDAVHQLRSDLLDKEWGILPKVLVQTTKHNGRLTRTERTLLVIITALVVLIAKDNPLLSHLISAFL